mmetsp:Transcript_36285/g.87565  ORF Transcript_36285/g.87565 Transcript_36285/m.87565 type:complete len:350 (-) Transcript_36285:136-1185(-)
MKPSTSSTIIAMIANPPMSDASFTHILQRTALSSVITRYHIRHHGSKSSSALSYTNDGNTNGGDDETQNSSRAADISSLVHQAMVPSPTLPRQQPLPSSSFLSRLRTDDDWKEWQYSFGRNGLTDFLPQFSSHISCLSIDFETQHDGEPANAISGAMMGGGAGSLPWQSGDESDSRATTATTTSITNVPVSTASFGNDDVAKSLQIGSHLERLVANGDDFDCILDSGVMNAVVSSIPSTVTWHSRQAPPALLDLVRLMHEANNAIREFGIYVAITDASIPDHARGYLDSMGEVMGMEWNYDLDGVSNDEYCVSVARKYCAKAVNFDLDYVDQSSSTSTGDIDDRNLLKP